MPGNNDIYVSAREILLDALEALSSHAEALTLIGAQAIYLQVDESDLAIPPFTSDADLAIDPTTLENHPPLERLLIDAGFKLRSDQPGIWVKSNPASTETHQIMTVDLLVPQQLTRSEGRRGARLAGHDSSSARKVTGIEGVLVDFEQRRIESLRPNQTRYASLRVAGRAGLLVAKLHKIRDRVGKQRSKDKDSLDVFRLLRSLPSNDLIERYFRLLAEPISKDIAIEALRFLREDFANPKGIGLDQLRRAVYQLTDVEQVVLSCRILSQRLVERLERPFGRRHDAW